MGPLACSPLLVIRWRLWCTQVGSDGKTDPQELKDTLSRLPSKTLPDQQPPGQLVRNALLRRICHHATFRSPSLLCAERLVWRAEQQASRYSVVCGKQTQFVFCCRQMSMRLMPRRQMANDVAPEM